MKKLEDLQQELSSLESSRRAEIRTMGNVCGSTFRRIIQVKKEIKRIK